MSKYSYNKHIFAMKIHMPVKAEAKSRQVRSYSTCHKHKFYFHLLSEWFLRWASVYLYLPWLSQEDSSKMTRSQRIITFCFACSLHFQLEPLSWTVTWSCVFSTRWLQLQALQAECYKINLFGTYFGVYRQKVLSVSSVFIRLRYRRQPYHKVLLQTCIFTCFAGQQNETVLRILYRWLSYTSGFYELLSHQMLVMIC